MTTGRRFKVALSFPGEYRAIVKEVAEILSGEFTQDKVFYDNYYKDELARPNLDIYLLDVYKKHADLVVVFLCEDYDKKEWCGLEWRAVRTMIMQKRDEEIMLSRFDKFEIDGSLPIDGYLDIKEMPPKEIADWIVKRAGKLNTGAVIATVPITTEVSVAGLQSIEKQIEDLKAIVQNERNPESQNQLQQLTQERDALKLQLLQSEEIIEQNKKLKEELAQSLAKQQGNEELKSKALEAVEKGEYAKAKEYLIEATKDKIKDVAEDYYQLGKVSELNLEYREALQYYETAARISPDNPAYLHKAGGLSSDLGYLHNAIIYLDRAIAIEKEKTGPTADLAVYYNEIGLVWKSKGEYDKAIGYFDDALHIAKEFPGSNDVHIAVYYNNLGTAWASKGEYNKAIKCYEHALAIDKQYYGESHPSIATEYNNLGEAWRFKGEYDKAIGYYEQTLAIDKQYYGEFHPDIAIDYNNLGFALASKGEYDKAIGYYEQALVIDTQYFGESHPKIAIRYNNLGDAWDSKGEYDKAIGYYEQALAIDKQYFGESHPKIAIRYNNLGLAWDTKGEYDKAIAYLEQALEMKLQFLGENHPSTQTVKRNLELCIAAKNKKS